MAQYATLLYFEDVYGSAGANGFRGSLQRRWDRVNGSDMPIGLPVRDYSTQEYSAIVYGRGPLFLEALAETMGPESFSEFLKDYYQTYQWGIASSQGFQETAEEHCGCDLSNLFDSWVYGAPPGQ
jgi:aminopeptidase N